MRHTPALLALSVLLACGGSDGDPPVPFVDGDGGKGGETGPQPGTDAGSGSETGSGLDSGRDAAKEAGPPDPGPPPTQVCTVNVDGDGFFQRTAGIATYTAYVPSSYSVSTPMPMLVGLHGCGDNAYNFATWALAPWDTRAAQTYIALSVEGTAGNCYAESDEAKVLAAIADIRTCYWAHMQKITIAGYSSGGELAYMVGMKHADAFAGILAYNTALYSAPGGGDALMATASRKLPIAHFAHTQDGDYPIADVKADWVKISAAGFPLVTHEAPGPHDGQGSDWVDWELKQFLGWIVQ